MLAFPACSKTTIASRAYLSLRVLHEFEEIAYFASKEGAERLETRRCYAFDQLACLHKPEQWRDLRSFAVIESERCINGNTSLEWRCYISTLPAEATRLANAIRAHWSVENRLHWCMDVAFADDQMRARTARAAHNLAVLKHITLNLIRLDPTKRTGGIKAKRLIAATSDLYRSQLLGLA